MEKIKIWNSSGSDAQINDIALKLKSGETGILPTDCSYIIAGDALNPKAVDRICRLGGINPNKHHLTLLCDSISMVSHFCRIDNSQFTDLKQRTPGPYTFILKGTSKLPKAFKARKHVGIRIPDNDFTLSVVSTLGSPLICIPVPLHDPDYAVNPDLMAEAMQNNVDFIVDDGEGTLKEPSIIDYT